jgi:Carboxypeptidase regulatory-like domain/TonB dependent receptor
MRSRTAWLVVALIAAAFYATPALAQVGQGRLTGTVTDAQGAVLPGVTVTATSQALIGNRTTVTEADGKYLFPGLPSGAYKLAFDLQGFKKFERDNIQVVLGQTISQDAQMQIGSLTENVTVTGASPVVDVTTTKVGASLKGDALIGVPTSTDAWGALSEAPGVRMQGFDVGGSHKSQQSGYESFGVQNQSRVISEGVDHTESVGGTGFYEDFYANEEVSVSSLGSDVEMNSPGAAIVTTIKSGGNQFKGLENVAYEPGKFVGTNAAANDVASRGYTCPPNGLGTPQCDNPNLLFWEAHFDLGGPVMKDKLWFYGAYNQFKIDKQVSGVSPSVATDLGKFNNYTGKGTAKVSNNNTVIGYAQAGRKQKPFRGLSTLVPPESILAQDSWSAMYKGEWQSVLSNRAFLDINVGRFTLAWPMVPAVDPAVKVPSIYRSVTGLQTGAGWNAFTTKRSKPQVKAQMTYYLPDKGGSHDFKFGFEDMLDSYHFGINGQSGPYRLSYATPTSTTADRIRFVDTGAPGDYGSGWNASPTVDQHYAGFLQDRWSPTNRLSVTLGVRIDYQAVGYQDGSRKPTISDSTLGVQSVVCAGQAALCDGGAIFPSSTPVAAATFLTNTDIAPRIGFSYNVDGTGKTVLKAFYGRYYNNIADGFSGVNPGGQNYNEYNFNDLNHNGKYDGPSELGGWRTRIGGDASPVLATTKTPHTDEYSVTVEHQFWEESSIRGTYVRKMQKDFLPFYYTPMVTAWLGNVTVPVTASYLGTTYNLLDVPNSLTNLTGTEYTNFPDGSFTYDTIEVAFTKRLGTKLFFQASGDYQWRNELRSADQSNEGSTSPLSTDPIGVYPQISVNPNAPNRQKTTMYHAQLSGRYTLPYDVGLGLNYRFQSGFPYAPIVPDGSVGLNVCQFNCAFFAENMDQHRSEAVNLMNFRVDKAFPLGGHAKAVLMLDIYNLLNADPVTNFNLSVGPSFGTVIAVLDPRVFQMGFRLEF